MRLNWRNNCNSEFRMQNAEFLACTIAISLSLFIILNSSFIIPVQAQSSVLDLNDSIQVKRKEARALQEKIAQYKKKISVTQKKAASLSNQINILESNIAKTGLEIQTKEIDIEQLGLETELVQAEMEKETARMAQVREEVSAALRRILYYDRRPYLEIVLARSSFSEVFDQLFFTQRLGEELKRKLEIIQDIRAALEVNKELLQTKKDETAVKKKGLEVMQISFEQERRLKGLIL